MSKKRPLPPDRQAECKAAHDLYLSKKHKLGLSQKKIADAAGITAAAVNLYFKGINPLNAEFAAILSREIGEPIEAFSPRLASDIALMAKAVATTRAAATPESRASAPIEGYENVGPLLQPYRNAKEYPLISWVAAGSWQESCDNFQPGDADEWLLSDVNAGPHGYWLQVKGPSMLPTFTEGMRILVKPEGFDLVSGKFYIARLRDTGETTFKQYIRDSGLGFLQPLNPAFPTLPVTDNVQIIGQVVDGKLPPIF